MAIVGMIVVLIATLTIFSDALSDKTPPLAYPPPATFPVVVAYGGEAHVAYWYEVEQLQREHPDWSFRIPPAEKKAMNVAFERSGTKRTALGHQLYIAGYEVSDVDGSRQRFVVDARVDDDEDNRSTYLTDGRSLIPEAYHSSGTGPHMGEGLAGCGIIAAWLAMTVAVVAYVRSRQAAVPPAVQ